MGKETSSSSDCVPNYIPISLLTATSKVFEKIIIKTLTKYLETKNIFSESQFGFKLGKAAHDALHSFTNFIVKKLDNKKKYPTVNLAKAMDTVSFQKLREELEAMGVYTSLL